MPEYDIETKYALLQDRYNKLVIASEQERITMQAERDTNAIRFALMSAQLNNAESAFQHQKQINIDTIVAQNDERQKHAEALHELEDTIRELKAELKMLKGC